MSAIEVAPVTPEELEAWPTIDDDPHKSGVAREAERLDRLHPGWADKISTGDLVMSSCRWCILGQLYHDHEESWGQGFGYGWAVVNNDASNDPSPLWSAAYGSHETKQFWIEEINARRA